MYYFKSKWWDPPINNMSDLIEEDINDYNNDDYISKNVIVINIILIII